MVVANFKEEPAQIKDVLANFCPDDRFGDGYGFAQDIIDALDDAGWEIIPKFRRGKSYADFAAIYKAVAISQVDLDYFESKKRRGLWTWER